MKNSYKNCPVSSHSRTISKPFLTNRFGAHLTHFTKTRTEQGNTLKIESRETASRLTNLTTRCPSPLQKTQPSTQFSDYQDVPLIIEPVTKRLKVIRVRSAPRVLNDFKGKYNPHKNPLRNLCINMPSDRFREETTYKKY